jgi:hypothetical protein
MGIGIAFVYFPLLVALFFIALFIGANSSVTLQHPKFLHYLTGMTVSIAATMIAVWMVAYFGYYDWESFFIQLAITLIAPFVIGIPLLIAARFVILESRTFISQLGIGALHSIIVIPFIAVFCTLYYRDMVNYPSFSRLCRSAEIKSLVHIEPAKSVALLPDNFSVVPSGQQAYARSLGEAILNYSQLEFIERFVIKEKSGAENQRKYERISAIGERILHWDTISKKQTEIKHDLIDTRTAEYEIKPVRLQLPDEAKLGIGGSRIEIRRTANNELIAYAQYYWDNKTFKVCPEEVHKDFPVGFITSALNTQRQ